MSLMRIAKFERFFRVVAGLDVDKSDLRRYSDFVNAKIYDLLLRGQAAAKANGRDIIEPFDPPITKGLQERIHEFRNIDEQIELKPILDRLAALPPLDLAYSEETEAHLPEIAGGTSVALAHAFKIIQDHRSRIEEPTDRTLLLLGVDLQEPIIGFELGGGSLVSRRHGKAWTTPRRPEIDDHRNVIARDMALEGCGIGGDRLS